MAFFTDSFLNTRRDELLRSVYRFQYCINGVWRDGDINSKKIEGTAVVVFVSIPSFNQSDTITGVRVYDRNGDLAGQKSITLKRDVLNTALLRFIFPLVEEEA